jgi:hypothetical protein
VDMDQVAGVLLIVGSLVFCVSAAVGVPRVFGERDPEARLRMLEEHIGWWRAAQPLYVAGPLIASVGVGVLAGGTEGGARVWFGASCAVLLAGVLAWSRSVYLRATRVPEFAYGTLPGWPFRSYVLLTNAGLALLGIGLLVGDFPAWTGWLSLGADAVFLGAYLRFGDVPPFVFYLLLIVVGVAVL